jgi:hypothetical protein
VDREGVRKGAAGPSARLSAPGGHHDIGCSQLAGWYGVAMLALSAIDQMFIIPACPFWSLMIIAVDVVALYGLCAYGSRANLAA